MFTHDAQMRSYAPGEWVVQQGDTGSEMFVIIEGEAEIKLNGETLDIVHPGQSCGEMGLIGDFPRVAGIVAVTPLKVAPIDRERFEYLVRNHPYFALEVMKTMVGRIRKIDERLYPKPA